jgi:hypothetical protein
MYVLARLATSNAMSSPKDEYALLFGRLSSSSSSGNESDDDDEVLDSHVCVVDSARRE